MTVSCPSLETTDSIVFRRPVSRRLFAGEDPEDSDVEGCCGCTARICVFIWGAVLFFVGILKIISCFHGAGWKPDFEDFTGYYFVFDLSVAICTILVAVFALVGSAAKNTCMLNCVCGFAVFQIFYVIAIFILCILLVWNIVKISETQKVVNTANGDALTRGTDSYNGWVTGVLAAISIVIVFLYVMLAICAKRAANN